MMKKYIVLAVAILFSAATAMATEAHFSWLPNKESELAGYKIHYGASSGEYDQVVDVGLPETGDDGRVHYVLSPAPDGMTYYTCTAYDEAGNESGFSSEISADLAPSPPSDVRIVNVTVNVNVQ